MRLKWLFGLVDTDIKRKKKTEKEREKRKERKPKSRGRQVNPKLILKLLRTRGLIPRVWKLITDLLRLLKPRDFKADIKVGLDDPADTGVLFAIIGPPLLFIDPAITNRISIQPSFAESAVFEGYMHAVVRFLPIQIVLAVIGFIFSLPALRVAWTFMRNRWKRKK
jgi:hypothetical protein